jgi:hypothetical protein
MLLEITCLENGASARPQTKRLPMLQSVFHSDSGLRVSISDGGHRERTFRLQSDNGNHERRKADPIQPEKSAAGNRNGRDGTESHDN